MIFESHAHYDDEAFDEDRDELLSGMAGKGVGFIINVGANLKTTENTVRLTEQYPFVYGAAGVHPADVEELDEEKMAWLREQCGRDKIVAVGEIGLDYHWPEPAAKVQKRWFVRQLELAAETGLPVIIHSRDAAKDTLDILKQFHGPAAGGVIHCFSYSKEMAEEFLKLGYYFGIGGVVTFSNAKKLKEAVRALPADKLLLETDSPYLAPVPYRGKRNSSLNLGLIAQAVAEIKGMTCEEVVRITAENAARLFSVR